MPQYIAGMCYGDVHCPHFVLELQQVDCVVPRAEDLELVQQLLGCLLCVERRTPLRKWRDPYIRDDADDKPASLAFGQVVYFSVSNPCLVDGLLFSAVKGSVFRCVDI